MLKDNQEDLEKKQMAMLGLNEEQWKVEKMRQRLESLERKMNDTQLFELEQMATYRAKYEVVRELILDMHSAALSHLESSANLIGKIDHDS